VLPDFLPPGRAEIGRVSVNGLDRTRELKPDNADDFQIRLDGLRGNAEDDSIDLTVEFITHRPPAPC
jgi:hypothetical protein